MIFDNNTIEFTSIQKCGQLREYVLEIIHKQVVYCKGTKSRPFALKISVINYISFLSEIFQYFLVDSSENLYIFRCQITQLQIK